MMLATPTDSALLRFVPSLQRWVDQAIQPGSFLTAVLRNDLRGAFAYGDHDSIDCLRALVTYIHCNLPAACWGSSDAVDAWRSR